MGWRFGAFARPISRRATASPLTKRRRKTGWKYICDKGGARWTFKLSKVLKQGGSVLFGRASDGQGLTVSGYGAADRKAFRVK